MECFNVEDTVTHLNCGLLSDRSRSRGQEVFGCWVRRSHLGLPSSGLSACFLNTYLMFGEVLGADSVGRSGELSSWSYDSTLARLGEAHQFF